MKKKAIFPSFIIILICIAVSAIVLIQQKKVSEKDDKDYSLKEHKSRQSINVNRELTEKITIGAIGDILIHSPVYLDAFKVQYIILIQCLNM